MVTFFKQKLLTPLKNVYQITTGAGAIGYTIANEWFITSKRYRGKLRHKVKKSDKKKEHTALNID